MRADANGDSRMTPLNVGPVPPDWEVVSISEVATSVNNGFVGQCLHHQCGEDGGVLYLQGFNVRPNRIELTARTFVTKTFADQHAKARLGEGDVLTVQSGHVGTTAVVPRELAGASCHALIITRPRRDRVSPHFLAGYMNSYVGQARIRGLHVGSSILHINTSELAEYKVPLPPLPEQVRIAEILLCWDSAIAGVVNAAEARRERKRGLMQQLLTGQMRLRGFKAEWRHCHRGDVVQAVSRPVAWDENQLYRLAIVRRRCGGVDLRAALYGHQIKVKKLQTIRAGDFLLSNIQAAYGAMGMVPPEFDGAKVSELYTILRPKDPKAFDLRFLGYMGQTKRMWHMAIMASNGFFAERLRLNFDPEEFLRLPVVVPPTFEEQAKIADVLECCDREIELLERELAALKQQKRGLMQKLLTGAVRVKV
jgi:type I restriction enzyme S subunit